jgi:hypothetical protein
MHAPCTCHARARALRACRPSPPASAPSLPARRAATSSASPAPYATQGSNLGLADPWLQPRTSRPQAGGLLLTRLSLASARSPAAVYRGSSCTSPARYSRTSRWVASPNPNPDPDPNPQPDPDPDPDPNPNPNQVGERPARLETARAVAESRAALAAGGVESLDMLLLERPGESR